MRTSSKIIIAIGFLIAIGYFVDSSNKDKLQTISTRESPTEYYLGFNVDSSGYDIYSSGEIIKHFKWGDNPKLDSVIEADNQ